MLNICLFERFISDVGAYGASKSVSLVNGAPAATRNLSLWGSGAPTAPRNCLFSRLRRSHIGRLRRQNLSPKWLKFCLPKVDQSTKKKTIVRVKRG